MFPKRERPLRLSNEGCCFSDEEMAAVTAKDDAALDWRDFAAIFTLSGCTAKYNEQLYYLPIALACLKEHPHEGTEYLPGLTDFITSFQEPLANEGFLDGAMTMLRACFDHWTAEFKVVHYDAAACAAKGWKLDHDDHVEHSDTIEAFVDDLYRYGLTTFAEELVESWIRPDRRPEDSAWLLEFARATRERYDYYSKPGATPPHLDMTPTRRSQRIVAIVTNQELLQAEFNCIRETIVRAEQSPTYWSELVSPLGLKAR